MKPPICIDLFCGLGGWTEGFLAEGYRVIGFDIERRPYPGQLVLQDIRTLHGSQFRNATVIVASPPCQKYSYMAMPWTRSKELAKWYRDPEAATERLRELTELFDTCFRLQREASEAAGRYIPLVVENVKGAQPWVGPSKANFGSFYLWGDVESVGGRIVSGALKFGILLPRPLRGSSAKKVPGFNFHQYEKTGKPGGSFQSAAVEGTKVGGFSWSDYGKPDYVPRGFNTEAERAIKNTGGSWFGIGGPGQQVVGQNPVTGVKNRDVDGYERTHPDAFGWKAPRTSSGSSRRKEASALIAKIPFPLARHIARVHKPSGERPRETDLQTDSLVAKGS